MTRLMRTAAAAALALCAAFAAPGTALASPPAPSPAASATAASERAQLPRPTGPYGIGRTTLHLTDDSRKDPWVPQAGGRAVMVDVFYPAVRGTGSPAPYATTGEIRVLLAARKLEGVPPEAMAGTRTDVRTGARPDGGRHPLVVLSPGFGVPRYTLTSLAEDLTSRGYVVASVDHAYEAYGVAFPGRGVLTCVACETAKTPEDFHNVVTGRAKDVSFVLDRLTGPRAARPFARMIDKRRIGMAGHSIGGAGAAATMAADGRVRAGVNMDGAFQGAIPAEGLGGRPFMMLGTNDEWHRPGGKDTSWDEAWPRLGGGKRWLTVDRADHFTFTDSPVFAEQIFPPTVPRPALSAARSVAVTRAYTAAFFDRHLRHLPQPLLDGPSPANPEVHFNNPTGNPAGNPTSNPAGNPLNTP
ncbi:alpha/beta hydrolase [Streptomyces luteireticuli]|uniref:Lipase n=1 Tax=Streptomyces luteireticuli TaxID=173858 RepID=A0ABP3IC82_9ACTN